MCDSYNDLQCPITISTIGSPDGTFVAQKVGEDLQFRGVELVNGVIGVVSPTSVLLNTALPITPVPDEATIGETSLVNFPLIPPINQGDERPFSLASVNYTTGLMVGSVLTITNFAHYLITFAPSINPEVQPSNVQCVFRIRDSANNIYAQFYMRNLGNDENTTTFSHIILLPPDTYTFTNQIVSSDMPSLILPSHIGIRRV